MGKSSSELMCCRGCLATDCNLFDIHKNQLAEAYECITGYPVLPHDGFPQRLCAVCGVLLAKSAAFRDRCRRARDCLRKQHHNKEQQLADWRQFSASKKRPAAFSCQECGKGFDQLTSYQNHLLRHGPSAGRFPCAVCSVRFKGRSKLNGHELRHALRFICRECKFVSRDKTQAKLHFSAHEGHKFQCKHCEKSFVKRSSYLSHVRLVHVAQNVTCVECGETFVSRLGLKIHYTTMHQAQKAASKCACASCGAPFDNAEALQAHARAGCDPAKRPCATCGASLLTDEALRTHTEECHKGEFKCTEVRDKLARRAGRRCPPTKPYGHTRRSATRESSSALSVPCRSWVRSPARRTTGACTARSGAGPAPPGPPGPPATPTATAGPPASVRSAASRFRTLPS
ncbi:uncharacterized protein isoform X3 [Choristoneura fumiferana]|uniref:uncharacterized protein isoform X3 n=1 Tax=Choristoneura fumiferana TaxID=7141 RepID=UPI003D155C00